MIGTLINRVNENCYQLKGRRVQAPRAVEAHPPIGGQVLDAHLCARARSVNEAAVAEIDADMRKGAIARVVEDQVAGGQLLQLADWPADFAKRLGAGRQQQAPRALEHVRHQPAAIEAGLGRAAAKAVLDAERVRSEEHTSELQSLAYL